MNRYSMLCAILLSANTLADNPPKNTDFVLQSNAWGQYWDLPDGSSWKRPDFHLQGNRGFWRTSPTESTPPSNTPLDVIYEIYDNHATFTCDYATKHGVIEYKKTVDNSTVHLSEAWGAPKEHCTNIPGSIDSRGDPGSFLVCHDRQLCHARAGSPETCSF